jgi:hypothetical protein
LGYWGIKKGDEILRILTHEKTKFSGEYTVCLGFVLKGLVGGPGSFNFLSADFELLLGFL